jgi:glucose-6-phosphate isomerase
MIETANIDHWNAAIRRALGDMARERVMERILARDWTVWKPEDREISDRLGWLDPVPKAMDALPGIEAFARRVRKDGFTRVVLLGMGGSSLAPEVFRRVRGSAGASIPCRVLDTTSPDAVARAARGLDMAKTFFIVSSKSGTTAETSALFNYFYSRASDVLGKKRAGTRFAAITDPGTPLDDLAHRHGFRRVFSADPAVGGRYSALTVFGLVPAAIKGFDLRRAMAESESLIQSCRSKDPEKNPAAVLGTILGVLAGAGIDKATFLVSPRTSSFADWLEQLIAESTGKEGKGIVPIPERSPGAPGIYGRDRMFISIGGGDNGAVIGRLKKKGFPAISVFSKYGPALPGQFYLWEMATAVAGRHMGINPFDQPDVESTKRKTREALAALKTGGKTPAPESVPSVGPGKGLAAFLSGARPGGYVAIQAFLDPVPATRKTLEALRDTIRNRTRLPATLGFGPRYLHSTGQLHKGDSGRGYFIQITGLEKNDVPIPEIDGMRPAPSFGALIRAQAQGDWMALRETGRRIIRIDLGRSIPDGLRGLLRHL